VRIADRTEAFLARQGYGRDEPGDADEGAEDDALALIQSAAVAGRSATRRGRKASRLQLRGGRPRTPQAGVVGRHGSHRAVEDGAGRASRRAGQPRSAPPRANQVHTRCGAARGPGVAVPASRPGAPRAAEGAAGAGKRRAAAVEEAAGAVAVDALGHAVVESVRRGRLRLSLLLPDHEAAGGAAPQRVCRPRRWGSWRPWSGPPGGRPRGAEGGSRPEAGGARRAGRGVPRDTRAPPREARTRSREVHEAAGTARRQPELARSCAN
jgi:hypothetical protein